MFICKIILLYPFKKLTKINNQICIFVNFFSNYLELNSELLTPGVDTEYHIKHAFDPWHFVHVVYADLRKYSKSAAGKIILPWIESITNMIWYAFDNCEGNHKII